MEVKLPYKNLDQLPEAISSNLPKHAQEIYLESYNSAWEQYKDASSRRNGASREETAHRVAWSAVKKSYGKDNQDKWVKKGGNND